MSSVTALQLILAALIALACVGLAWQALRAHRAALVRRLRARAQRSAARRAIRHADATLARARQQHRDDLRTAALREQRYWQGEALATPPQQANGGATIERGRVIHLRPRRTTAHPARR